MKQLLLIVAAAALLFTGCTRNERAAAYGTFTASEVYPASEVTGKIIDYPKIEGEKVTAGEVIAILDTTDIQLQILEMQATIKLKNMATTSREIENSVLNQELENLNIEIERFRTLTQAEAAPAKNLEDLTANRKVLTLRIQNAEQARLTSIQATALAEIKLEQLIARKQKHFLRSPLTGTLLEKYVHAGEIALAGKSYCKVADLSIMTAKVYVSETQLPELTLGKEVILGIDSPGGVSTYFVSHITNISQQAEFTPKIIQTKEQRVKLVYEVELQCLNEGELKIGMPVEMYLDIIDDK
ncbi:MAG: efflux RND transporter periplasmic adaptor subunit [Candidatus Cloacimonetes bacterium]|nr:efflux RND transporter periplasmic adaptor subunit [Candidatus Cloacimonadota bacterium]